MNPSTHYFHNAAATVSYAPAGYIRLAWAPVAADVPALKAIYEQVLRAMRHHGTPALLTLHQQRPPLPAEVQEWLAHDWVPRAVAETGYGRCAIVEAGAPLSRLAARAVGSGLTGKLSYQFFASEPEAVAWLLAA